MKILLWWALQDFYYDQALYQQNTLKGNKWPDTQTCRNKQNEGGQPSFVIRRKLGNRRNTARFIFFSFIRHSCRPSFHDTSTSGTREILCMSLKRCHDSTSRAEKLSLLRIWGEKRSQSHLTSLVILLSFVSGRMSWWSRQSRRKSL